MRRLSIYGADGKLTLEADWEGWPFGSVEVDGYFSYAPEDHVRVRRSAYHHNQTNPLRLYYVALRQVCRCYCFARRDGIGLAPDE